MDFFYLNRDNRWPDFQWEGLELRPDGALQLFSVPLLESEVPSETEKLDVPSGPAGIAFDLDGTITTAIPRPTGSSKSTAVTANLGLFPVLAVKTEIRPSSIRRAGC